MTEFNVDPSPGISVDDAHRLISGSSAAAPIRAARKIRWRRLARLPARRPGCSAGLLLAAWYALPGGSSSSLLCLIGAAVFGKLALDRWKRKKGARRG